jgi:phosphoribosylanthranilate isomerase
VSPVKIKMCGFTVPGDVRAAVMAGAQLIGLNFCPRSPRAVSLGLAARLADVARSTTGAAAPVQVVAVFADPEPELVTDVIAHVRPDLLQFHGDESPEFCERFQYPYLKAIRARSHRAEAEILRYQGPWARGYLVDSFDTTGKGRDGGTGIRLRADLARLAGLLPGGFLAGGLTPENVAGAIALALPGGVDVASGIELRPGVKSEARMVAFAREVRRGSAGVP